MTPFEQMRATYQEAPQARPFEWYLDWHHRHGYVWSTPRYFLMGRGVVVSEFDPDAPELQIFPDDRIDAWYIHAMAGEMPALWEILPWELPRIGWERVRAGERELQFFRTADLRRLCPAHETHVAKTA